MSTFYNLNVYWSNSSKMIHILILVLGAEWVTNKTGKELSASAGFYKTQWDKANMKKYLFMTPDTKQLCTQVFPFTLIGSIFIPYVLLDTQLSPLLPHHLIMECLSTDVLSSLPYKHTPTLSDHLSLCPPPPLREGFDT